MENETIIDLENAPDTQLDAFPTIGECQLDDLLMDINALIGDMPDLSAGTTAKTTPSSQRRDRMAEKERKLRRNAKRFYRGYFIGVAVLLCALLVLMIPLHNWLVRFESTQPDQYSQYVYETYFAQPDWAKIYDLAQTEGADLAARDAYVAYMQSKVDAAQDKQITYYETSAGLSKDHKYIVELDGKRIASFMLTSSVNGSNMTEWEMIDLQLVVNSSHSVTVLRFPGQTVLVNDKELGDECIVRTISTKAEEYLPEGIHGYRVQELYMDGLLTEPSVQILDAEGQAVDTVYNEEENRYEPKVTAATEITDVEQNIALNAAKANALFAIRAIGTGELSKYFDNTTQIYKDICNTPTFIQSFASYSFNESVTAVSDFYRYSDDLFSARVTLQLDITRKNGTVKSLDMNTTYFFTKNSAGTFMVTNITNVDLQETVEKVKLTFHCYDEILETVMVDTTDNNISLPQFDIAPGDTFLGWATKTVSKDGQVTMTILFEPGQTGNIPAELEPMTLYAVFE